MGTVAQHGIEAGERTAPVSSMYISMLYGMLDESFRIKEPSLFDLQILFFKNLVKKDELFKKTSKKFQAEFLQVLDYPIDRMYTWVFNEPYIPVATNVDINVEAEPEKNVGLSLVK